MLIVSESGLHLVLDFPADAPARLLHLGAAPFDPATAPAAQAWAYRLAEITAAGEDADYIAAGRYAGSGLADRLRTTAHSSERHGPAHHVVVVQQDARTGIEATTRFVLQDGTCTTSTSLRNTGAAPVTLQAVSAFFMVRPTGPSTLPRNHATRIHVPRNGWYAEFQWTAHRADELGLSNRFAFGSRHFTVASTGTWCSANYLPLAWLENIETGHGLLFEILHGGSWSWQVAEAAGELYLHVAGPTEAESAWWRTLQPAEIFTTPEVALAPAPTFDTAIAALTRHRRRSRLTTDASPVVFNDYMNCLMGDPTAEKVAPLVEAAAALGAEVYCMDAGWYAVPGERWSATLGRWEVEPRRFPNGLKPVFDRVRALGMVPGLWFEIEAMTANCPGFDDLPDDWFFTRHGRRTVSHRRHQLDFRNPHVRTFASRPIDTAIEQWGVGFLKLDYNFSSGPGSDHASESQGESLLAYEAAFLGWLDDLRARHPHVMIEHCASGGQRLARPYLDRTHNASNSDEGDPFQVARIAAAAPTMVLPEQNGTWALPSRAHSAEETAFAMLCAIPFRMLLAGDCPTLREDQRPLIEQAIAVHKAHRAAFATAVPGWPLGLPAYDSPWLAITLTTPKAIYLAVWRRTGGEPEAAIPLPHATGGELLYPSLPTSWSLTGGRLHLSLPERAGRLLRFALSPPLQPEPPRP